MNFNRLKVYFFFEGKHHVGKDMHSRPMVGDIVILKDGDYIVKQVVWPYGGDNELDYLTCNVVIEEVNKEGE